MKITEKEVYEMLRENHIYPDNMEVYRVEEVNFINIQIDWGDWKHEHLRLQWLMDDLFRQKGITAHVHYEQTTEEDGSDTYSALHEFRYLD